MKALLIIGMQVDFLPGGPAEVPDSQSLVPILNQIIPTYDLVVAANFALPADHVMFAANHLWRKPGQSINLDGHPALLHNINCVPGSFGAEFIPGLKTDKIAFTAQMGTDSLTPPHSAFFDFDKKRDTGLAAFLASQNVDKLHVAGMPLETQVQQSVEDAISLGFQANLLIEACRSQIPACVNHQPSTENND
ncbi:MAG: isochorismatase family protein [Saprospiraceae bacterium]|nr:isochorismatase family protein [Saprospiraceae bacterium]MCF8250762.1 isochorismatase family protein [Saprospiraceae bacterium]MCF8282174.1 isochorismatase family protein [Bacteroidales bacterium]MCF8312563.1 isochorismatase family protein [Saprospiraceae bacterium]MCF8440892.1 isochorismatase family protein [Saprospiraceae bacterium]